MTFGVRIKPDYMQTCKAVLVRIAVAPDTNRQVARPRTGNAALQRVSLKDIPSATVWKDVNHQPCCGEGGAMTPDDLDRTPTWSRHRASL
jgi:hypothetical protein